MKRVLIVAYYFPPMGLSGVQRTLKFVKYLRSYNWQPTVLTVSPHGYYAFDEHLLEDLSDQPIEIWRTKPGLLFQLSGSKKTIALDSERRRRMIHGLSQLLFVPDNKIGWRRQVGRFLKDRDLTSFDAIFTTSPPQTAHLIGLDLKRKYNHPLVTDFREAWVDYAYQKYWTPWHRQRHRSLQDKVIRESDAITTTSHSTAAGLVQSGAIDSKIRIISQGFDPADFMGKDGQVQLSEGETHFVFTGIFYADRNPLVLFQALRQLRETHPKTYARVRFHFIGYLQNEYRTAATRYGVSDRLNLEGYVDHTTAITWQRAADVLWFNTGKAIDGYQTPGKAFEYLGSARPILALIPDNALRQSLKHLDHILFVEPDDNKALAEAIVALDRDKQSGTLTQAQPAQIEPYDRRLLTGQLAETLDSVT